VKKREVRVGGEKRNFIGPRGGAGDDAIIRNVVLVDYRKGLIRKVVPKKAHHVT
jgi:hypothetical protein